MISMQEITIIQPDDWHCHFRDGEFLLRTVSDCAQRFKRSVIMPNLIPPVTSLGIAENYLTRIQKNIPKDKIFEALMTLYLTDNTSREDIFAAKNSGIVVAAKLYPAGATTHSAAGVTNIKQIYPALAAMQECGLILCVHGEVVGDVDIFEREGLFIDQTLSALLRDFPKLKIVLEHISTKKAVEFVKNAPANLGATITPHHLLLNRNDLLAGGIKPHYYCLPILKTREDQAALISAATSGNPKFFLGTDSAPHAKNKKEHCCGCAGIYSSNNALEIYAEIFEKNNALDKLENFAAVFGAQFYGFPINQNTITLVKKPWRVPNELSFGNEVVVPLMAGEELEWQIKQ